MKIKVVALALLVSFIGMSQELPEVSSSAKVNQRIGLTDVEIEYSRPNVNGRKVFGELVPYGKIWRLGANACTKFTVSSTIELENTKVLPPGSYALFATPNKDSWTIHLNTDDKQWGAYGYKPELDAMTIEVKTKKIDANEESFSISFANVTTTSGVIVIKWADVQVEIPFKVPTKAIALGNIENAIKEGKDLEKVYANAAEYHSEQLGDQKTAMEYAEKSIKVKKTIQGLFTKASILKETGKTKEAIKTAEEAEKLAKEQKSGWEGYIRGTIDAWSKEK